MRDTVEPHWRRDRSDLGSVNLEIAKWWLIASVAAVITMGTVIMLSGSHGAGHRGAAPTEDAG